MHTQGDVCGQEADREAAGEGLQQHSCRSVWMLPEDGHQHIDAALSDSATIVVHVGGVSTLPGGESVVREHKNLNVISGAAGCAELTAHNHVSSTGGNCEPVGGKAVGVHRKWRLGDSFRVRYGGK